MNNMFKFLFMAGIAAGLTLAADSTPFDGTWKLNVSKSKFESPAKKAQTVIITKDGATIEETLNDGTQRRWSYKADDGKESPITGLESSSVTSTQLPDGAVEHNWKMGSQRSTGKGVLSGGGKTMTYTLSGKTADGKAFKDVMIFDKQ
jgi:hypothetical protein